MACINHLQGAFILCASKLKGAFSDHTSPPVSKKEGHFISIEASSYVIMQILLLGEIMLEFVQTIC